VDTSEHTKTTMDGGRNGGQTIAELADWRRDQDQLMAQIKTTNNASAGVQTLGGGAY
jgi:hypothetical protein